MGLVRTLKSAVDRLRADPYHYECAVCDRTFETDRSTCPDCGGDVERVAGAFESTAVDPHP
jgi:rRNA maturation endonuclease Nob1